MTIVGGTRVSNQYTEVTSYEIFVREDTKEEIV